jgi:hypothetical protein
MWERWRLNQQRTLSHRFRSEHDALLRVLYFTELLAEGPPHRAVPDDGRTTVTVRVRPELDVSSAVVDRLRNADPLSLCFNDEIDDSAADGWLWEEIRRFLGERFPVPSPFERQAAPSDRRAGWVSGG